MPTSLFKYITKPALTMADYPVSLQIATNMLYEKCFAILMINSSINIITTLFEALGLNGLDRTGHHHRVFLDYLHRKMYIYFIMGT